MKQYLLSMYAPEGGKPDPDTLAKIMTEVQAIREQLQKAGQWVFAGGLHEARTATVVRYDRGGGRGARPDTEERAAAVRD